MTVVTRRRERYEAILVSGELVVEVDARGATRREATADAIAKAERAFPGREFVELDVRKVS